MKKGVLMLIAGVLFACSKDKIESSISCTEKGCTGTFTGPEFQDGEDIAHQFSNKMSGRVGDELKKKYEEKNYSKIDLEGIEMSTEGMNGIGTVTYKIFIPFQRVDKPCDAYTAFDHRGGWNHIIKESGVRKEFANKKEVQLIEKKTKEGLQEFWLQFKHEKHQAHCE